MVNTNLTLSKIYNAINLLNNMLYDLLHKHKLYFILKIDFKYIIID